MLSSPPRPVQPPLAYPSKPGPSSPRPTTPSSAELNRRLGPRALEIFSKNLLDALKVEDSVKSALEATTDYQSYLPISITKLARAIYPSNPAKAQHFTELLKEFIVAKTKATITEYVTDKKESKDQETAQAIWGKIVALPPTDQMRPDLANLLHNFDLLSSQFIEIIVRQLEGGINLKKEEITQNNVFQQRASTKSPTEKSSLGSPRMKDRPDLFPQLEAIIANVFITSSERVLQEKFNSVLKDQFLDKLPLVFNIRVSKPTPPQIIMPTLPEPTPLPTPSLTPTPIAPLELKPAVEYKPQLQVFQPEQFPAFTPAGLPDLPQYPTVPDITPLSIIPPKPPQPPAYPPLDLPPHEYPPPAHPLPVENIFTPYLSILRRVGGAGVGIQANIAHACEEQLRTKLIAPLQEGRLKIQYPVNPQERTALAHLANQQLATIFPEQNEYQNFLNLYDPEKLSVSIAFQKKHPDYKNYISEKWQALINTHNPVLIRGVLVAMTELAFIAAKDQQQTAQEELTQHSLYKPTFIKSAFNASVQATAFVQGIEQYQQDQARYAEWNRGDHHQEMPLPTNQPLSAWAMQCQATNQAYDTQFQPIRAAIEHRVHGQDQNALLQLPHGAPVAWTAQCHALNKLYTEQLSKYQRQKTAYDTWNHGDHRSEISLDPLDTSPWATQCRQENQRLQREKQEHATAMAYLENLNTRLRDWKSKKETLIDPSQRFLPPDLNQTPHAGTFFETFYASCAQTNTQFIQTLEQTKREETLRYTDWQSKKAQFESNQAQRKTEIDHGNEIEQQAATLSQEITDDFNHALIKLRSELPPTTTPSPIANPMIKTDCLMLLAECQTIIGKLTTRILSLPSNFPKTKIDEVKTIQTQIQIIIDVYNQQLLQFNSAEKFLQDAQTLLTKEEELHHKYAQSHQRYLSDFQEALRVQDIPSIEIKAFTAFISSLKDQQPFIDHKQSQLQQQKTEIDAQIHNYQDSLTTALATITTFRDQTKQFMQQLEAQITAWEQQASAAKYTVTIQPGLSNSTEWQKMVE